MKCRRSIRGEMDSNPLREPALQYQRYNEKNQQGKSQVRSSPALLQGFDRNNLDPDRVELRLKLGLADRVQSRLEKRRIYGVQLRRAGFFGYFGGQR